MSSYPVDRERFQALMESEGMPREISKRILRWANTYQRLAVLACNGDRRPYVPCPGNPCVCDTPRLYGSAAIAAHRSGRAGTLVKHADPIDGSRAVDLAEAEQIAAIDPALIYTDVHEPVPPVAIEQARAERMIREWCFKANHVEASVSVNGFVPIFQGDPRGACTKLRVPSGRTDDGNHEGICVPTRRY